MQSLTCIQILFQKKKKTISSGIFLDFANESSQNSQIFVEKDNWVWTGSSNHIQVKEDRQLKLDHTHLSFKLKAHSFVVSNLCLETKGS